MLKMRWLGAARVVWDGSGILAWAPICEHTPSLQTELRLDANDGTAVRLELMLQSQVHGRDIRRHDKIISGEATAATQVLLLQPPPDCVGLLERLEVA